MARNGFKVFDSDTHVGPHADILERYTTADVKERLKAWEPLKATGKGGHTSYRKGVRKYERRLGMGQDRQPNVAPGTPASSVRTKRASRWRLDRR